MTQTACIKAQSHDRSRCLKVLGKPGSGWMERLLMHLQCVVSHEEFLVLFFWSFDADGAGQTWRGTLHAPVTADDFIVSSVFAHSELKSWHQGLANLAVTFCNAMHLLSRHYFLNPHKHNTILRVQPLYSSVKFEDEVCRCVSPLSRTWGRGWMLSESFVSRSSDEDTEVNLLVKCGCHWHCLE